MFVNGLLLVQLIVLFILAALHLLGIFASLYDRLWWLDIVTHFLGGIWAGFFAAWSAFSRKQTRSVLLCACFAFTLGVLWEVFEATTGLTVFPADTFDTITDLGMDTLGGIVAAVLSVGFFRAWPSRGV